MLDKNKQAEASAISAFPVKEANFDVGAILKRPAVREYDFPENAGKLRNSKISSK